jgi:hypothetical protein
MIRYLLIGRRSLWLRKKFFTALFLNRLAPFLRVSRFTALFLNRLAPFLGSVSPPFLRELDNPRVLSEATIGTRGSTSDAATDHLAFNYFRRRDLLALPMTICEGGSGGNSYSDLITFSGLLVYRVTLDDGFVLLGGVPHEEPGTSSSSRAACDNWCTESDSKVKRSIFMSSDSEDFVYSIAMDLINVSNLKDLENPLASVALVESE